MGNLPDVKAPENEIEFIATPEPAPSKFSNAGDYGVKVVSVSKSALGVSL